MSKQDVGRLWWLAMEKADAIEKNRVPENEKDKVLEFVFFVSGRLLRSARRSHGRLSKPPGLEELRQFAAKELKK